MGEIYFEGVGKTTLSKSLKSEIIIEHSVNDVLHTHYEATVGCDIQVLLCEYLSESYENQGNLFFVELVDIGGNVTTRTERNRAILYDSCDAVLFVWWLVCNLYLAIYLPFLISVHHLIRDVTSEASYHSIENWLKEISFYAKVYQYAIFNRNSISQIKFQYYR